MKYVVTLICILLSIDATAQIKNGTYKSDNKSFRQNYFLVKKANSLMFYGWELDLNSDTIYYKSSIQLHGRQFFTFEKFYFSKDPVTEINIANFKPDKTIMFDSFFLHRHFVNMKYAKGRISLSATKDLYDGRADEFQFDLIE